MDLSDNILSGVADILADCPEPEKRQPVTCVIEHPLLPEHLADYADQSGNLSSAQKADEKDVQTLRARHHGVARLLAEGLPEGVIAEMTGYTPAYISTLKNNPSMIELITFYRSPKTELAKVIGERLRAVADMSLELIEKKLLEQPDGVSITELTGVAKLGFDRSGHGPQSTVHSVSEHHIIGAEELVNLSRDARRRDREHIVDVREVRRVLPAPEEHEDERQQSIGSSDLNTAGGGDDPD